LIKFVLTRKAVLLWRGWSSALLSPSIRWASFPTPRCPVGLCCRGDKCAEVASVVVQPLWPVQHLRSRPRRPSPPVAWACRL